ncbi:MAG TPA: 50S ribosomal protein L22 [bacterium]|jgi:large subunit ribosomal protein L22|nr:50S ribosomal protein L22 [bacterium]
MKTQATARYLRTGDRKVGAVLKLIRGKKVEEALSVLRFTERRAAEMVEKTLLSAIANGNQGETKLDMAKARVLSCVANQGGVVRNAKRFIPRAMGRASGIRKKQTHLTIVLSDEPSSKPKK